MMPTEVAETPFAVLWILRCPECGSTLELSAAEAMGYAYTEWPQCCGEVMTLGGGAKSPND
jgi:hypothetical protein